ncbi:bifunctional 4-alpha-glucanotransferase/amylo-alpha-1,6-glucosidase [Basidiobolus ranarum]|uniref:Bifunctional 4-alpha-glucanotransferase/amylo-alpha-1,6-glucosidase n=1 Tax=Basidiobolus ranarum TaxID=34480 RepID=A0ABR2WVZ9_9FUNG
MSKVSEKLVVYQLDLEDDGSPNSKKQLIRLPSPNQPYGLRIRLVAGSLAAKGGVFYTNYPVNNGKYERTQFNKVNFVDDHITDCYCDIMINQAGTFEYYVEYDSPKAKNEKSTQKVSRTKSKSGHFLVAPNLKIKSGKGKKHLPLDGIVLQSIVPKWLGPISQWADQIKGISQLGYNMLHFVPLQQRGMSNSPYSIFDQLALSDDLFEEKLDEKTKFDQLKKVLNNIEENYGVLGLTDVVYNHTANNSEWLQHHPEAGYNLVNSPHLIPAFEFDTALLDYSAKLSEYGIPTKIESDNDLCQIVDGVRPNAINKIKLWEFYIVDTKKASEELRQAIEKGTKPDSIYDGKNLSHTSAKERAQLLVKDALFVENVGARFGKRINTSVALALLSAVFGKPVEPGVTEDFIRHYEELLSEVNFIFYKKYDDDVTAIINNIRNQTIYQRLDKNGPRMGEINNENPLIQTYFTRLPDNEITRKHPKEALALANNGWIWSADPLVDFASTGDNYLRREVIVWADCVKLRYGKSKEDNPWLWDHMAKYTESMATLFQGFRIDNCHSTPIHVAEYLLDTARRIRPDLYVLAELFTGSEDKDRIFVNRLGINSLIREAMQAWDAHELSRLVHRHGGLPVGSMYFDCLPQESVATVGKKQVPCTIVPLVGALPHALSS